MNRGFALPALLLAGALGCEVVSPYAPAGVARRDGAALDDAVASLDGVVAADAAADGALADAGQPDLALSDAALSDAGPSAVTFVRASSANADGPSLTFLHTVDPGSNRLLLVTSHLTTASYKTSSVTYGVLALTRVGQELVADSLASEDCTSSSWYLTNPPVGTDKVVITITNTREIAGMAMTFNGVDQTTPIGDQVSGIDPTLASVASVSVTAAPGQLVVDSLCLAAPPTVTLAPGSGQTIRVQQDAPSVKVRAAASTKPGAPSVTMSWSFDAAAFILQAFVLRPAP